ncbi:Pyridine nucleotide-disulfide oxidoreductase domain-containing protein 1 [Blastocladiella emersonii ATCC 22665]|nr:Pyridine nucleotide-disulfide oxidoreductase domain-containing protein 1 [Blastocladiella emersonii ATCC 22665]
MVRYVVLGGGVGGVTCAEELSRLVGDGDQVYLISQSRILKIVTNVQAISKTTETFDLIPTDLEQYRIKSNFHVLQGTIAHIDRAAKCLVTVGGTRYPYDKLCLATGARPNVLFDNQHVIGIRDIESVDELCDRLSRARRIMVVGNGGIALELLNEIRRIPMIWAIKDAYLGNTFLDAGASAFFMPHLFTRNEPTYSRILPQHGAAAGSTGAGMGSSPVLGHLAGPGSASASASPSAAAAASLPTAASPNIAARPHLHPHQHLHPHPHHGASASSSGASGVSPRNSALAAAAHSAAALHRKRKTTEFPPGITRAKAPGAALGPVWRTSLVLPPTLTSKASDRDLIIETESQVAQLWTAEEYAHAKKRRRVAGTAVGHDGEPKAAAEADEWIELHPAQVPEPVEFVPHMGLFGEGRLGLLPRDEVRDGEQLVSFPGSQFPRDAAGNESSTSSITAEPSLATDDDAAHKWPLYVRLTNNKVYGVDFMVSATGVLPNSELARAAGLVLTPNGGIAVDKAMRTSDPDVYGAGDCVSCTWSGQSLHWFQMRLWSQARLMGLQAARSMVRDSLLAMAVGPSAAPPTAAAAAAPGTAPATGAPPTPFSPALSAPSPAAASDPSFTPLFPIVEDHEGTAPPPSHDPHGSSSSGPAGGPALAPPPGVYPYPLVMGSHSGPATVVTLPTGERRALPAPLDVHFDLFAHVSRFFGFKVVLLGLFNAQGLAPGSYEVLVRSTHPGEYVKLVKDKATNQLRGAMLIGETDLEEMFENLILTRADVNFLEDVVMDPDMDLEAPIFADDDGTDPMCGDGGLMADHDSPFAPSSEAGTPHYGAGAGAAPPLNAREMGQMLAADFDVEAMQYQHAHDHSPPLFGSSPALAHPTMPPRATNGSAAAAAPSPLGRHAVNMELAWQHGDDEPAVVGAGSASSNGLPASLF